MKARLVFFALIAISVSALDGRAQEIQYKGQYIHSQHSTRRSIQYRDVSSMFSSYQSDARALPKMESPQNAPLQNAPLQNGALQGRRRFDETYLTQTNRSAWKKTTTTQDSQNTNVVTEDRLEVTFLAIPYQRRSKSALHDEPVLGALPVIVLANKSARARESLSESTSDSMGNARIETSQVQLQTSQVQLQTSQTQVQSSQVQTSIVPQSQTPPIQTQTLQTQPPSVQTQTQTQTSQVQVHRSHIQRQIAAPERLKTSSSQEPKTALPQKIELPRQEPFPSQPTQSTTRPAKPIENYTLLQSPSEKPRTQAELMTLRRLNHQETARRSVPHRNVDQMFSTHSAKELKIEKTASVPSSASVPPTVSAPPSTNTPKPIKNLRRENGPEAETNSEENLLLYFSGQEVKKLHAASNIETALPITGENVQRLRTMEIVSPTVTPAGNVKTESVVQQAIMRTPQDETQLPQNPTSPTNSPLELIPPPTAGAETRQTEQEPEGDEDATDAQESDPIEEMKKELAAEEEEAKKAGESQRESTSNIESIFQPLPQSPLSRIGYEPAEGGENTLPKNQAIAKFGNYDQAAIADLGRIGSMFWSDKAYCWEAPDTFHEPLFFEEITLERYGHHTPGYQSIYSGAHFVGNLAFLPYKLTQNRYREPIYTIRHMRPGNSIVPHSHLERFGKRIFGK